MKSYPNRIIGFVMLLAIVITGIAMDYPTEVMYLLGSLTFLLVFGIPDFMRIRRVLREKDLVQVKSDWLSHWMLVGYFTYSILDKGINAINITSLSILIIYGVMESVRNYRGIYVITDQAIFDVDNKKLIDASDITEIETTPDGLMIHTVKYRNDFGFKSSKLLTPIMGGAG